MTRQEYELEVTTWPDLLSFMAESEYDFYNDVYVYDDDDYDREVKEDLGDIQYRSWWEVRSYLDDLPDSCAGHYYRRNGWLDFDDLDETDFDNLWQEVLDYAIENDRFDDSEDDDESTDGDEWYVQSDFREDASEDMEIADGFCLENIA